MKDGETKGAGNDLRKPALLDSLLIFLLPLISVMIEHVEIQTPADWRLLGKWFVFWAFGLRLFTSGIKQASNPSLPTKRYDNQVFELTRSLGIVNICLGVGGILSLINETWRPVIAILGCLFFGLNSIRSLTGSLISGSQKLNALSDVLSFVILFFICYAFFNNLK